MQMSSDLIDLWKGEVKQPSHVIQVEDTQRGSPSEEKANK